MSTSAPKTAKRTVAEVYGLLRPFIRRTPTVQVAGVDLGLETPTVTFKLEQLQVTRSFKARGAFANLLLRDVPKEGVVAASGGNHGVAVAYAAMRLGVRATIFVPSISSEVKIARIREYGADLHVVGASYTDAFEASEQWRAQSGAMPVHAFDAAETMLGTATIGMELEEQAPAIDTLLVPVGGGGLLGGIASYYDGRIKLVGVEPAGAPKLTRAIEAGRPVDAPTGSIAADSLAPRRIGALTLPVIQRYLSSVLLVADDEMRAAQRTLWERASIVAEPGGAAASAALFAGRYIPGAGERVCVLVSGANTTAVDFSR